MFKKLKEKITEEVKSSPQRFQQFTQSVSDKLQNSTASDENFFSIGEDDANTSNASLDQEFSNVSLTSPQESSIRRNSTSSVASDVSFLPRYESYANMYHLQSDLDVSASEVEDNISTSSQLGQITKEQVYSAFQKAQTRYHKYRGRYTDLDRHYRELERENAKMKSVLVETQDKAIRRVTELKEQCALEQKAKAHLEAALRDEIDEKQLKIEALQTKVGLLQNGTKGNGETLEVLDKYLTDARQEIENLNERIQEMKANSIILQTKEQDYKAKIASLEKELASFSERERENNLSLAQNKMELHNELFAKDTKIATIEQENDVLKQSLASVSSGKLENLQTQNKNLIEKLENLTHKCNSYESELLRMEQLKIELQNANQINSDLNGKINEAEERCEEVRNNAKKSLLALESKVRGKIQKEFEQKEEELKGEFQKKFEEVSSNAYNLQHIQIKLVENDKEIKRLKDTNSETLEELSKKISKYEELERNHLELIEDSVALRNKISTLEKEITLMQVTTAGMSRLEEQILMLEEERDDLLQSLQDSESLKLKLDELEEDNARLLEETSRNNAELYREELELKFQKLLQERENRLKTAEETSVFQNEELKELKAKNEEIKLGVKNSEEEKIQLRERLSRCENLIRSLSEDNERWKNVDEEKELLLQENEDKVRNLEESKGVLLTRVREIEEALENDHQKGEERVRNLEEANALLNKEKASLLQNDETKKLKAENEEMKLAVKNSEEERNQLRGRLTHCENLIIGLSEDNERWKNVDEKKELLLEENEDKVRELEESKAALLMRVREIEEALENEQQKGEEKVRSLEEANAQLKKQLETEEFRVGRSEEVKVKQLNELELQIEEKQSQVDRLNAESKTIKDLLNKCEIEKSQLSEEMSLMKKLLEESNNNVTIKEHELKRMEEDYKNSGRSIEKLSKEIENREKVEKELITKIENYEIGLTSKNERIELLSKKIEEYNESLLDLVNAFPGNHLNNSNSNNVDYLKEFREKVLAGKNRWKNEKEELLSQIAKLKTQLVGSNSIKQLEEELIQLREEKSELVKGVEKLKENVVELELRNTQIVSDSNFLSDENQGLITELETLKVKYTDLEGQFRSTQAQVEKLEEKLKESVTDRTDFELHVSDLEREKQLLRDEIAELKVTPVRDEKEVESLRNTLVQYKSLDLTSRSSIEFYENEVQKLKNLNEKLSRKLDETLVTLNHCAELSTSTEIEYLRNVLYNYMLGKESLVLARVIAAVCKFDPRQTETILAKEQQKQTLLGQLGIL